MANKFGKGYYDDWEEMIQGIRFGCERAFKKTCQDICKEVNERIRGGIYEDENHEYDRTFEMWNMKDYVTCDIKGLECQFLYDNKAFETLSIDSYGDKQSDSLDMAHHGLSDDGKNANYGVQEFMDKLISPIHNNFMDDVRDYIRKEFKPKYREYCKEEGFILK